jgi:endonuclease/exonuclease/phosphatase family metal-dependent hydrolase
MMLCGLLVRPPLVIVIYRPQAVGLSPEIFLDDFSTLLEELIVCSEELLIMGDFNLHIDDIENTQAVRFISLLDSFGLKQHVVSPTHRGGHILDPVITRDNCVALEVRNICVLERPVSDHKPIWFNLNLEKQSNQRKTVVSRRLKNFDCE